MDSTAIQQQKKVEGVVEIRCLEIKEMHDWVMCPISYNIFLNPVIAEDGHIYEHDYIFRWFDDCKNKYMGFVSPLTKKVLNSSKLIPCQMSRQMVNAYLSMFPEKKELQYKSEFNMKIWMYYFYNSITTLEQYIRHIDSISVGDMTFQQFSKCVKLCYKSDDPLLGSGLWLAFFNRIQDIHADFMVDESTRRFLFEDDDLEDLPRAPLNLSVLQHVDSQFNMIRIDVPIQIDVPVQIDIPEWEEEGEVLEEDDGVINISSISIANSSINVIESETLDRPLELSDLEEEGGEVLENNDREDTVIDDSNSEIEENELENPEREEGEESEEEEGEESDSSEESEEEEEEEVEEEEVEEVEVRSRNISNMKIKKEHNNLLSCLCLYGNLKILEVFLERMPAITCPNIANKYRHLFEDFMTIRNLTETTAITNLVEIDRFEKIIKLMIDKGIPYNNWTRDGNTPILVMIYLTTVQKYYPYKKLNMKLVQMPEFFQFPQGASSGSLTPKKALKKILSKTVSIYASIHILEQYKQYYTMEVDDILDLCVKYSEHNIWVSSKWNTEPNIERLMFEFVRMRGSIPMELVLLNSFSSRLLNHCFIEGYNIENPEKMYQFPRHLDILPPIMNEDVLFPKINTENTDFKIQMEIMNQIKKEILNKIKKEWKNIDNNLLKRVEYSKFHGTEWAWDVIQPSTEQHPIIQPPPVMSVLGWLIYMYEPPIVSKFLEINANMKLNMKSQEQTGLDYVSPIHLAVKYHNDSEYTEELLKELLNRGASLEQKTSHGWYPIHYACRYSPKLVSWVILNSENKDKHANMPLYFYPSCNTLKIAKQKLEWYQTWLPLNIFILNHCNTYDDSMIKIMNHIINYGGKRTMDELREATGKDNSVFEYDGPIGFNIGTTIINTVLPNNPKSKNIKKRKLRHV